LEKGMVTGVNQRNLEKLREKYHVTKEKYPEDEKAIAILFLRVDTIPPAMVIAQAAIESGWGTSRFAEEGHNLFGQ
jgi:Bax protein